MVYLILSVVCGWVVSTIFKYNEHRQWDRLSLLTANYVAAAGLSLGLVLYGFEAQHVYSSFVERPGLCILVVATGLMFIGTYYVRAWATKVAGMGLATGVLRVSVVVPVFASWLVWNEVPSLGQSLGLVLAVAAFIGITKPAGSTLSAFRRPRKSSSNLLLEPAVLGLLFIAGGIVDVFIKTFDEVFAAQFSDLVFLQVVYLIAAVAGGILVLPKYIGSRTAPPFGVWGWGIFLGIANYAATLCFLRAVRLLTGPYVFPVNSVGIVLGAVLIGVVFWKETLTVANWVGIALAAVALFFLQLG